MKKLILVLAGLFFLTFAATTARANHEAALCYPITIAKAAVAIWDKTAVWEYLKEGYRFDALMAWAKARIAVPEKVAGILVAYVTDPKNGDKRVLWAISSNGDCVENSTFQNMPKNEFDNIAGKDA